MLQKFILIFLALFFAISCNTNSLGNSKLLEALKETHIKKEYSEKELIDGRFDDLIAKQLSYQQAQDSSNFILKTKIFDKILIAFPIDKSSRLDYHIYKYNNDEEVRIGLHDNFYEFENSNFNRELNLAKFYFDDPVSDTTINKFFEMCILPDFEVVEL